MFKFPGQPVLLFLLLALFVGAGLVGAGEQDAGEPDPGDLDGKWRFITTGDYEGYVNGSLKIGRDAAGAQTCKLVVYQSEFGSAVERCVITKSKDKITITAEDVVSSSVPSWRREVFELSPGQDEMIGVVRIVVDFPVRFTRKK